MGYYSSYEVIDTDFDSNELLDLLHEYTNYTFEIYADTVQSTDAYKWYYWKDDLVAITAAHPGKYIEIERTGEESPDIERGFAINGKISTITPKFVWPAYD